MTTYPNTLSSQADLEKQQALEALCEMEKLQKQLIILKEIQQLSFEIDRVQRLKVEEEKSIKVEVKPYNVCHPPSVSTMSKLTNVLFIFSSIN